MTNMTNISAEFETVFVPFKAFLVFESDGRHSEIYVEAYDIDENDCPINAHPLSKMEINEFAQSFAQSEKRKNGFLNPAGLIPENILYTENTFNGVAIWHTPPKKAFLHFASKLNLQSGEAYIPALLWKATRTQLEIYAIKGKKRPTLKTPLYNAPFFNVGAGGVCMGTVNVDIPSDCALEEFTEKWEYYFFHSYFSHGMGGAPVAKGNLNEIWKTQIENGGSFPEDLLVEANRTVKNLIS